VSGRVAVRASPAGVPGAVTDPGGLDAEELVYPGANRDPVNGYLVRPREPATLPGMVVIHEAGGLGEHIRDVCNRIAQLGYVTIGVDMYSREGGPPPPGDMEALFARLFSMSDANALGDLDATADLLRAREDCTGRVGCIGFCMGGRYSLLFACASDRLDAAVDCWGGFVDRATPQEETTPLRPTPPLAIAHELHCPLLAAIGAEDTNPSPEIGAQLRERAQASGQPVQVDVYEGAGHAFFADYRPSYRPEPAALLWSRVVPFLDEHLHDAEG
jgi:carboxymethylenebutenolidase